MNTTPLSFPSNTKINQIVSMTPSSTPSSSLSNTTAAYSIASPSSSSISTLQPIPTNNVSNISAVAHTASSSTTQLTTSSIAPTTASNQPANTATSASGFGNFSLNLNIKNEFPFINQIHFKANCSHCGSNGVKAAFYGKSKLYCSVACQNGKRNPQQQTHGVKRTIDAVIDLE